MDGFEPVGGGGVFYLGLESTGSLTGAWFELARALLWLVGAGWFTLQFYTLPALMVQERQNLGLALRNGLRLMISAPGYSLAVGAAALAVSAFSLFCISPLAFGGPMWVAILGNRIVFEFRGKLQET
ncbi:MAG: hypothetical protein M1281_13220 [Chloroflexi bacterium]|nr:hypothetical protein [Chloroflexota bacterium]